MTKPMGGGQEVRCLLNSCRVHQNQMTTKKTFHFGIDDKILVKAIRQPGVVLGLTWDEMGPQYKVRYWNDGNRCCEWMFPDEIKDLK